MREESVEKNECLSGESRSPFIYKVEIGVVSVSDSNNFLNLLLQIDSRKFFLFRETGSRGIPLSRLLQFEKSTALVNSDTSIIDDQ